MDRATASAWLGPVPAPGVGGAGDLASNSRSSVPGRGGVQRAHQVGQISSSSVSYVMQISAAAAAMRHAPRKLRKEEGPDAVGLLRVWAEGKRGLYQYAPDSGIGNGDVETWRKIFLEYVIILCVTRWCATPQAALVLFRTDPPFPYYDNNAERFCHKAASLGRPVCPCCCTSCPLAESALLQARWLLNCDACVMSVRRMGGMAGIEQL